MQSAPSSKYYFVRNATLSLSVLLSIRHSPLSVFMSRHSLRFCLSFCPSANAFFPFPVIANSGSREFLYGWSQDGGGVSPPLKLIAFASFESASLVCVQRSLLNERQLHQTRNARQGKARLLSQFKSRKGTTRIGKKMQKF